MNYIKWFWVDTGETTIDTFNSPEEVYAVINQYNLLKGLSGKHTKIFIPVEISVDNKKSQED